MPIRFEKTEVLIVGGGPTGLFASILLSQQGVPHILVECRPGAQPAPAAHVINTRSMELFRQAGLNMEALYKLNKHQDARYVSWVSDLRSDALGQFELENDVTNDHRESISQDSITNVSQTLIEEVLGVKARELAENENSLRYGWTWKNFVNGDTQLNEVVSSSGEVSHIRAAYVLAADGAGSPIARALGIKKNGPSIVASFLNLSCRVDMTQVAKEKNSLLYWVLDPENPAVCIVHDPKELTVVMRPIHEPFESPENFDDATCDQWLKKLFGPDIPFKVFFKGVWNMSAQVADKFRHKNVFLVGDSAHRFPPTGGLGLNSGVADAHNLVWKIVAHRNGATDELLDTYEQERRSIIQMNCDLSLSNYFRMNEVLCEIGLDTDKAKILPRVMNNSLIQRLPVSLQNGLKRLLLMPAKKALSSVGGSSDKGIEKKRRVQSVIDDQSDHFYMPGMELGYIYRDGIAVSSDAKRTKGSIASSYTPITEAGARFPHVWLNGIEGKRSTLDLVGYQGYTLLVKGEVPSFEPKAFGLPTKVIDIEKEYSECSDFVSEKLSMKTGDWIFVRPDGHIAKRHPAVF